MKIRLTESKLKQIVAESVKNVLTELDWRTYNSAHNKAMERAKNETNPYAKKRAEEMGVAFHDASQNAYTDNYDLEGFDTTPEGRYGAIMDKIKHAYNVYERQGYPKEDIETSLRTTYGKYFDMFKKYDGNYKLTNGELKKAARRYDDTANYKNGNQEYKKGQGWVNKG